MPTIAFVERVRQHSALIDAEETQVSTGMLFGDAVVLALLLNWAKREGLLVSSEGTAAAAYDELVAAGDVRDGERVLLFETAAGFDGTRTAEDAVEQKRRKALPTSLPVGGIITPV